MLSADLTRWCIERLGSAPRSIRFQSGHLSQVVGAVLEDGSSVVLKARPADPRLIPCAAVQRHLWRHGFPCPELLAGPDPVGPLMVSAERLIEGADPVSPTAATIPAHASLLQRLVASAPAAADLPGLEPAPSWVGWDHKGAGLWPAPDDLDVDLNLPRGPAWIEEIGGRVRALLRTDRHPGVIGHVDWEAHNLAWQSGEPRAVHDWDSIAIRPDAAIAGAAAAVFTSLGPVVAASLEESESFLAAYQAARSRPFTNDELEVAWAAGLWVLAFNARKESVRSRSGPYQVELLKEGEERLRRSGA